MPTLITTELRTQFTPASVSAFERKLLFPLRRGDRVLCASAMKVVLADANTTSTITLGDTADEDGFITADTVHNQNFLLEEQDDPAIVGDLDLESGNVRDLVDGTGVYLAKSWGKLYSEPDGIYATYRPGTSDDEYGSTVPVVDFHVTLLRGTGGVPVLVADS